MTEIPGTDQYGNTGQEMHMPEEPISKSEGSSETPYLLYEVHEEDLQQIMSQLMGELSEYERLLHHAKINLEASKLDPNSVEYTDIVTKIAYYSEEILRLSTELDDLQINLFGVVHSLQDTDSASHLLACDTAGHAADIDAILAGIAPQEPHDKKFS
jgi:hypothetical protein